MAGSVNGYCALCTLPFGPARSSTSSRASVIPDGEQVACGNLAGMATMNLAARRRGDPRMFWTRPNSNSVAALVRRSFGGLGAAPRTSTTKIGASFGLRLSRSSAVLRTSTNTQSSPPPIAEAHWQLAALPSTTCLSRRRRTTAICAPERFERRLESTLSGHSRPRRWMSYLATSAVQMRIVDARGSGSQGVESSSGAHSSGSPALIRASRKPDGVSTKEAARA
jgi:hypothetical protein